MVRGRRVQPPSFCAARIWAWIPSSSDGPCLLCLWGMPTWPPAASRRRPEGAASGGERAPRACARRLRAAALPGADGRTRWVGREPTPQPSTTDRERPTLLSQPTPGPPLLERGALLWVGLGCRAPDTRGHRDCGRWPVARVPQVAASYSAAMPGRGSPTQVATSCGQTPRHTDRHCTGQGSAATHTHSPHTAAVLEAQMHAAPGLTSSAVRLAGRGSLGGHHEVLCAPVQPVPLPALLPSHAAAASPYPPRGAVVGGARVAQELRKVVAVVARGRRRGRPRHRRSRACVREGSRCLS